MSEKTHFVGNNRRGSSSYGCPLGMMSKGHMENCGARAVSVVLSLLSLVPSAAGRGGGGGPSRPGWVPVPEGYTREPTWIATVQAARERLVAEPEAGRKERIGQCWDRLDRDFPIPSDWVLQDLGEERMAWLGGPEGDRALDRRLIEGPRSEVGGKIPAALAAQADRLLAEAPPRSDPRWLDTYLALCRIRRASRLRTVLAAAPRIVFTRHFNMGASHYAYVEGQSDAQAERHFYPGGALCLLEMNGADERMTELIRDDDGVIRDPAVSWDGKKILFAWKKSDRLDDYHLYEMDVASRAVRPLTSGLGFADYEGAYLPDGSIVFNSTRCVQTVDCWWTEVSNLYACDADGRHIRRLTFDQVHDNYPSVLDDGRVVYTRWEYNDRGQVFVQSLFQMNPDGTGQTAFYGNNSWFPTTLIHARGIPGTARVAAIATGHHSSQAGKLCLVDPSRGREEDAGVQWVAPLRQAEAVRIDSFGQEGPLWMYPYPLNDREFLVTFCALGRGEPHDRNAGWFGIFHMDVDGRRELLAAHPEQSCNQAVPLVVRTPPPPRASVVDYRKTRGTYYVRDVYAGPGLRGIPRGAAKALRVVALDYRAAGVGSNSSGGEAGGALSSTPPAIGNGSWDVKRVLGQAPIHGDGSAAFTVPARVPVYFQVLDATGRVIQTMRSWSTLHPGESFACVGCHEPKNCAPPATTTSAGSAPPVDLAPNGLPPGFSFAKEVQPILDRHCVRCHDGAREEKGRRLPDLTGRPARDGAAKRVWTRSYVILTGSEAQEHEEDEQRQRAYIGRSGPRVNWVQAQSAPPMKPPYDSGAARSGLMARLDGGHSGVRLSRAEMDTIACWIDLAVPFCGDYREAGLWSQKEMDHYDRYAAKRRVMEAIEAESTARLASSGGRPAVDAGEAIPMRIRVRDAAGRTVARREGAASTGRPLRLEFSRVCEPGDRVIVEAGVAHAAIAFDAAVGEVDLFSTNGVFESAMPTASEAGGALPPDAWAGAMRRIAVRPLLVGDVDRYRNLARNPFDARGEASFFPHAVASTECRGEAVFAARNAIDGFRDNGGHGRWPYQSWGPERGGDEWWEVDFGRAVTVDKIVVVLRADFPHDGAWKKVRVVCKNGPSRVFELAATAEPQVLKFDHPVRTPAVRLTELEPADPARWCAASEIEVWGRDDVSVGEDPARPAGRERLDPPALAGMPGAAKANMKRE